MTDLAGGDSTFDRWYAPYAPPLNRAQLLVNIGDVGSRLLELRPTQLRREDQRIRRRWLTEPQDLQGLFGVKAGDVAELVGAVANSTAAAGLLSMHPSGHVREAAVLLLGKDPSQLALRFLLIRCGDWVPEVRTAAEQAVDDRLDEHHLDELLSCLGLVHRLSLTPRGSAIARKALDSVTRFATVPALVGVLRNPDVTSRRVAAQLLVENGCALDALEPALRQADPSVLKIVSEAALSQVIGGERDLLLRRLMLVRLSAVAELALWTLLQEAPDHDALAREALRDRRSGMRLLARQHLRSSGFDAAAFYRDLMPQDVIPAVRGLGDCGDASDAAIVAQFLTDPDPTTRRTAVDAVARLDAARYTERLIERLSDDAAGVAGSAARCLSRGGVPASAMAQLWNIMRYDGRPHVMRACARAAHGLPRWSRLRVALRSAASADRILFETGAELVDHAMFTWNHSFVAPTADEMDELTRLVDSTCAALGDRRCDALASAMSDYGIQSERASELARASAWVVAGNRVTTMGRMRSWIRAVSRTGRRR